MIALILLTLLAPLLWLRDKINHWIIWLDIRARTLPFYIKLLLVLPIAFIILTLIEHIED